MKLASRALACAASIAVTITAVAAPVTIDNEQKAAVAVTTALTVAHDAPLYHTYLMQDIRRYTSRALQLANTATTAAGLMASPSGITIPCEESGSMTARLAPRHPRVFKFEFQDCRFPVFGWPHSLDGPGEVVLLSDSLAPTSVTSIRFGNADTDLVQTRELSFPEYATLDVYRRNLRIVGHIPLAEFQMPGTETSFAYVFTGFVDETYNYEYTDGQPSQTLNYNYLLEKVAYAGVKGTLENWAGDYEDLSVLFGKLTFQRNEPYYGLSFDSEKYLGLRVQSWNDYNAFTRDLSIDGRVNKQYNRWFGAGCVNGDYTFKTRTPMHHSQNSWQQFSSGDLLINGSTRARFYSSENVPGGLPAPVNGMLLNLDVRNVGVFNYDSASVPDAIRGIAQCM